jgi:hypothetical protein
MQIETPLFGTQKGVSISFAASLNLSLSFTFKFQQHSSSREAKCRLVESFIQDQRMLLEKEQYLQRKTMIEIRSMIPLDTTSIEEELVRDDVQQQHRLSTSSTDFSTRRQRRYSSLTHSWLSNNEDNERSIWTGAITSDEDQHSTTQLDDNNKPTRTPSKRQWPKIFARWIGLGNDKKTGNNSDENDRLEASTETAEPTVAVESTMESTVAPAAPAAPREEEADSTQDTNQQQQSGIQRQTRRPARHVSWSVGTSYEEYKRQKAAMIEQGLYGLRNANIARALGGSQRGSKAPLLFQTDPTTTSSSRIDNPPLTTPTPSPHCSSQPTKEKDSGVSLVQQTLSSTRSLLRPRLSMRRRKVDHHVDSNDDAHQPSSTANGDRNTDLGPDGGTGEHASNAIPATHRNLSASERRRSAHIMDRYSPQLSALEEEDDLTTLMGPTLVAFRYPKMVRMKDLRDAAIHILSASEGEGDTNGKHKEPLSTSGYHHSTSPIKHNQG